MQVPYPAKPVVSFLFSLVADRSVGRPVKSAMMRVGVGVGIMRIQLRIYHVYVGTHLSIQESCLADH
jgi:hypothetical protein